MSFLILRVRMCAGIDLGLYCASKIIRISVRDPQDDLQSGKYVGRAHTGRPGVR